MNVRKWQIFIVDDHPLVRLGITQLVNAESDMFVCGEAEDMRTALRKLLTAAVDLVLLDLSLRGGDGFELLTQLRTQRPDQRVLVVSTHDERLYGERIIRAGASGYIMKATEPDKILAAIRKALRGDLAVSEALAASLLSSVMLGQRREGQSPLETLSDRELEVFQLLAQGMVSRDIAKALGISAKTVETHQFNVRTKLGAESMHHLRRMAFAWTREGGEDPRDIPAEPPPRAAAK